MSEFFTEENKTLHIVKNYAGAVKLPKEVALHGHKVHLPDADGSACLPPPLPLRRSFCVRRGMEAPSFFSLATKQVSQGHNYDLGDGSNSDLVEIQQEVTYK